MEDTETKNSATQSTGTTTNTPIAKAIHNITASANKTTRTAAETAAFGVQMGRAFSAIEGVQKVSIKALRRTSHHVVIDSSLVEAIEQTTLATFATIETTVDETKSRAKATTLFRDIENIKVEGAFQALETLHKASIAALLDKDVAAALKGAQSTSSSSSPPGFLAWFSGFSGQKRRERQRLAIEKARADRPAPTSDAPPYYHYRTE